MCQICHVRFRFELVLPAGFGSRFLFDFGLLWGLRASPSLVGDGHPATSGKGREKYTKDSIWISASSPFQSISAVSEGTTSFVEEYLHPPLV